MPIGRKVALKPCKVADLGHRNGHDQERSLAEACHGDVGFYTAAVVEPLRVDYAANVDIDVVGTDSVERHASILPLHNELREAALIEESDSVAGVAALLATRVKTSSDVRMYS